MKAKIDKLLVFFQRLGKAIMIPIAALPAAAIMMRLGQPDVWGSTLFNGEGIAWMAAAGEAIINQMNLLFAIGIAVGLAEDNNGTAGLAGAIGYFVITNVSLSFSEQYCSQAVLGYNFDIGFLAGVVSGIVAGLIYNKYKEIKLPEFLGFFGGKRFIPILTSVVTMFIGVGFGLIWPYIQDNISEFGVIIAASGGIGAFIFGFLNRLLIPFGLHHVLNSMFWFQFGEFITQNGEVVTGDIMRFLNGDTTAGIFQTGFFPIMMFGLPAVCMAMILAAKKENRKSVAGMMIGIGFASFLTGITEPIEFMFLFLSPVLFIIHALLTGLSLALTSYLGIRHGYSFSAGFIDYILNYRLATKPLWLLFIGVIVGAVYFIIFYFAIIKFNLKTPGRENDKCDVNSNTNERDNEEIVIKPIKSKVDRAVDGIIDGVGGCENIINVESCVTRVRLTLKDTSKVDKVKLKSIGSIEIMNSGKNNIQIIIGTMADPIVSRIKRKIN